MIPHLLSQLKQLRQSLRPATGREAAPRFRPEVRELEDRQLLSSSLLNVWYDATYSNDPYKPITSAIVGVSRLDPASGAEQVLYQANVTPSASTNPYGQGYSDTTPGDVAQVGEKVYLSYSRPGSNAFSGNSYGPGSPAQDDSSTIKALDPATGQLTDLVTRNRESLGLAAGPGGTLLNVWRDGVYGSNPYGPDAVTIGVSRFDPATGAEQVVYQSSLPGLPATNYNWYQQYGEASPQDVTVAGGKAFLAYSTPGSVGYAGNPYSPGSAARDDSSTIRVLDLGTGQLTDFAARTRETIGLAAGPGGTLLNLWYDGVYGTNPYGSPESITVGVSAFDPATGAERVLYQSSVSGLPATSYDWYQTSNQTRPSAVAAAGGRLFLAYSQYGTTGWPAGFYYQGDPGRASQDDSSTIKVINTATGAASDFATRGRSSLELVGTEPGSDPLSAPAAKVITVSGGSGAAFTFTPGASAGTITSTGTPTAPFPEFTGVVRTSTGDFNADGVPDTVFLTGPGTAGRVAIVSGKDGSTLLAPTDPYGDPGGFRSGGYVTAADIDGDGRTEFAVTPDLNGGPRVIIFRLSAAGQLELVANFYGIQDESFRDGARAAFGDVNRDGILDVFVIAAFNGGPRTALYDGADVLIASKEGRQPKKLASDFFANLTGTDVGRGGQSIAAGDFNGDGVADLVTTGDNLLGTGNQIVVFSGADILAGKFPGLGATVLANFVVSEYAGTATASLAVKNIDGDARPDLLAGSGAGQASRVKVYLGKDITPSGEPPATTVDPLGGVAPLGVYVG